MDFATIYKVYENQTLLKTLLIDVLMFHVLLTPLSNTLS